MGASSRPTRASTTRWPDSSSSTRWASTPRSSSPESSVWAARSWPTWSKDVQLRTAVHRDLQRLQRRAPGRVGQPAPAHGHPAAVGHRGQRPRGPPGPGPRPPRGQHDVGHPGPRRPGPGQPGVGPPVGGLQRARSAGPLPHRGQPHHDELLRHLPVAVPRRRHQAGHRGDAPVHRQRPGGGQHHLLGHARPVPRAQDRLGRERLPGGSRSSWRHSTTRWPRTPRRPRAALSLTPTEYFRRQIYATTWFERTNLPLDRGRGGRGQHHVRDRLPAPDLPLPRPAEDGRPKPCGS